MSCAPLFHVPLPAFTRSRRIALWAFSAGLRTHSRPLARAHGGAGSREDFWYRQPRMMPPDAFARLRSSLRQRGLLRTIRHGLAVPFRSVVAHREWPHPFDVERGVDTGGLLGPEKIASGHPHDAHTTAYFGSQPSVFLGLLERWSEGLRGSGQRLEDFTFIDIGCGKGRIVMLASEWAFRRVVGVELSPSLVRTAQANLGRWARSPHRCADISVVTADVLDYPLPGTPTLLFLYHPFEAELFEQWVRSLAGVSMRAAPLYLAYLNPVHEGLLGLLPGAQLLWTGEIPFSAAEAAAHLFGGTAERASLYRLAGS